MSGILRHPDSEPGKVAATAGGRFEVRLPSMPSGGYQWRLESCPEGLVLESEKYAEPPPVRIVGAAAMRVFTFFAKAAGGYELTFHYGRVWESAVARSHTVQITVAPEHQA